MSDIGLFGLDPSTLSEVRLVVFNSSTRACMVTTQGVNVGNSLGETLDLAQIGKVASVLPIDPNNGIAIIIRSAEMCSANLPDGLSGTVRYRFNDTDGQQTDEAAAVVGCEPSFEISANTPLKFDDQLRVAGALVVESAYQPPVRPDSADAQVGGIVGITAQGCVTLSGQGATFPAGSLWSDELGALILPNGAFRPVGEEAIGGGAEESQILQTPGLVSSGVLDYFGNCGFGPESEIASMSTS